MRVAILGSCVTRDGFSSEPDMARDFDIVHYTARSSIISIMSPPASLVAPKHIEGLTRFEEANLRRDLAKTFFAELKESRPDALILDFIDERYPIFSIGGNYICKGSGFSKINLDHDIIKFGITIEKNSPEAMNLWVNSLRSFEARIKENIPNLKIVVHDARFSTVIGKDYASAAPWDINKRGWIGRMNTMLSSMATDAHSVFAGSHYIMAPDDCTISDPEHKWGAQPYHYIREYYQYFMKNLREKLL